MSEHEHDELSTGGNGVDRRKFIRGAATVAWATPLILSLSSVGDKAHAQVASQNPCGGLPGDGDGSVLELCPCADSDDCADGCCCTGGVNPFDQGGLCATSGDCTTATGTCL